MHLDLHYVDPRLVALYDADNPRGADTDFYVGLAAELDARTIVDLGCGTGLLTRELAVRDPQITQITQIFDQQNSAISPTAPGNRAPRRRVIGVDPAPAMLAYARRQPGAEHVTWIDGDASAIGRPDADLAVMTGNVAQVFLDDAAWARTLQALYAALRPGGYLAFESRNPDARAWEGWNRPATHGVRATPSGPLEEWLELLDVAPGRVRFAAHNVFHATGETLVVTSELRFRTAQEIADSLQAAGFHVRSVYGDWQRGPLTPASRPMVFVARRD